MSNSIFFNAHHSPIGGFASLTLGCKGSRGGIGMELRGPADHGLYVGLEDRRRPGVYECLPFFDSYIQSSDADDYDVEGLSDHVFPQSLVHFPEEAVARQMFAATDRWTAGDLDLTIFSSVRPIPDPEQSGDEEMRLALVPAVLIEAVVDNTKGESPRKLFFGSSGSDRTRNMRPIKRGDLVGVAQGTRIGLATLEPGAICGAAFQPEAILDPRHPENLDFTLGGTGLVVVTVPPKTKKTVVFAVGFYEGGQATTGIDADYWYRGLFGSLEESLLYALNHASEIADSCREADARLSERLNPRRAATLGHAIHSYYGSTQLLRGRDGKPIWVVNEGEYRMMNTFDLTVDQVYFELALNPWTVRNVLDLFVDRYAYHDDVRLPDSDRLYPGGLAFAHDMGAANHFTDPGRSCYEQAGLTGVFSHMSCEELVNWVLCACLYVSHTNDRGWLKKQGSTLKSALDSLINRDHPEPSKRNGLMGLDSARCKGGAEITTYDSLDKSLGQARNNVYLGVKTWAAYVLMEEHLRSLGDTVSASLARSQAQLCADTIVCSADDEGYLPAVIGEGVHARIIPAIEGLVFPYLAGRSDLISPEGPFGDLRRALEKHFHLVLRPGVCQFPDGGWKLSSTSRNSWLSKIYLCQFIAEAIFGLEPDSMADEAHWQWLMQEDNAYFAWSDQMVEGIAQGSRYYPRGVTAALWLADRDSPIDSIRQVMVGDELAETTGAMEMHDCSN